MNIPGFNIEYCHIYTDNNFGSEQITSIKVLRRLIKELKKDGKTYNLSVLIDNYNPDKHILKINKYLNSLSKHDTAPNYYTFEKDLARYYENVGGYLKERTKRQYDKYKNKNNKIPCSYFIMIWYFLRLGIIKDSYNIIKRKEYTLNTFFSKKIINILPEKYREVEKISEKTIKESEYAHIFR